MPYWLNDDYRAVQDYKFREWTKDVARKPIKVPGLLSDEELAKNIAARMQRDQAAATQQQTLAIVAAAALFIAVIVGLLLLQRVLPRMLRAAENAAVSATVVAFKGRRRVDQRLDAFKAKVRERLNDQS